MNIPLILKQILSILASMSMLLTNIQATKNHSPLLKLGGDNGYLGTASPANPNFPASVNNFQDGDTINAGDWNAIENTIGTTTLKVGGSNTTTSIEYQLRNIDVQNNASGTLSVAHGGSATTTYVQGLVTASGTNAFGSLATNGNGSIPMASGTQFVANTLTAGSNMTITNSGGSITLTANTSAGQTVATTTSLQYFLNTTASTTQTETSYFKNVITSATTSMPYSVLTASTNSGASTTQLSTNQVNNSSIIMGNSSQLMVGQTFQSATGIFVNGIRVALDRSSTTVRDSLWYAIGTYPSQQFYGWGVLPGDIMNTTSTYYSLNFNRTVYIPANQTWIVLFGRTGAADANIYYHIGNNTAGNYASGNEIYGDYSVNNGTSMSAEANVDEDLQLIGPANNQLFLWHL